MGLESAGYWERFWRLRLSRRRLLVGAVLAGAGMTAGLAGCGGGGKGGKATPRAIPDVGRVCPCDARQPFVPAPQGMRGGVYRYVNFDPVVLDRFDPHQTQFGPMYANLSAVFSKLYMYRSHEEPTWDNIVPDLAEAIPEMIGDPPDTYIIKLRRGVRFHDSERIRRNFPSLAGRELTADDVIYSFERQRNPNSPQRPFYYRSSQYETIERIEKVDNYTIRIITKGPVAPFYHFLADTNAMIVPPEIIDQEKDTLDAGRGPTPEERMIGTGPFMWEELKWGTEFRAVRNPDWFGWGDPDLGRPYIDGYTVLGAVADSTREALFRSRQIDYGLFAENPRWVYSASEDIPELILHRWQSSGWLNSRLKVYCKPFDDVRVRKALHLAVDRQQVIDVIWSGHGRMDGPVGGAIRFWALPQEELERLPGYRQDRAGREQDIADARAAFEAAGSPELPEIWFADNPAYVAQFMNTYAETIRRNLGIQLRVVSRPTASIAEGLQRECDQAAMAWSFDNGWIDLDDWLYPYFKTGGPKNSFRVSDPELDDLLEAQRREFDFQRRRELGYEIQRHLLGVRGDKPASYVRLDYASIINAAVIWPYVRNPVSWPWFGNNYWYANIWLDRGDPFFQERPA